MRPAVKRRLATLAAAASLVLCVATAALWVRSERAIVGWERQSSAAAWRLIACAGTLSASRDATGGTGDWSFTRRDERPGPFVDLGDGFGIAGGGALKVGWSTTYCVVRAPLVALVMLTLVPPAIWVWAELRPRRDVRSWPRRLAALAAALSLVLCVVTAILWARSLCMAGLTVYAARDFPTGWNTQLHHFFGMRWQHGWLQVYRDGYEGPRGRDPFNVLLRALHPRAPKHRPITRVVAMATYSSSPDDPWQAEPHFARGRSYGPDADRSWAVAFPGWLLPLVLAPWPAVAAHRAIRRRRRAGLGRCSHCGYDLRATPDRCPECGAVPASAVGCAPP